MNRFKTISSILKKTPLSNCFFFILFYSPISLLRYCNLDWKIEKELYNIINIFARLILQRFAEITAEDKKIKMEIACEQPTNFIFGG